MLSNISDKISVIVPAYNIEEYLGRCLESILAQTYTNIEVIVVDDGSKDNTLKVAQQFEKDDNRVKVISKANEGVTVARLTGVKAATGQWIGFVDGDDFIDPEMYENLLLNAHKYSADISHCGYKMVFPSRIDYYYNTGRLVQQNNHQGLVDLLEGKFVEPALVNKLYSFKLLTNMINEGELDCSIKNNEDLLMNYLLFKRSDKSVYEDKCFYHYILRKGSAATSNVNEQKLKDPLKVLKAIKADCIDDENLQRIINARISANLIGAATLNIKSNPSLLKPYRKQARKELKELRPVIMKGSFSKSRKIATAWASLWPWSYYFVHSIYAKFKGIDKKFEVK